ncbi:MAG: serine--glyoxylate aminotransferase [Deltaproteobacteria bacterium HGW-Deltaproteobacteria-15]|nr:MAG: serine--glyoxylate aminotransferase [Deltaproteobacteria bacterium HGW-Deltaproteobacteria-15]
MSPHFFPGRHFLQIPGPTNVPEQVLRAMAEPTIDHRGPGFAKMVLEVQESLKKIFKTSEPVIIFPSSGTGAWEAALVNTLSPGDRVLMFETGQFATLWRKVAERLGLVVDFVPGDWRRGADPETVKSRLAADRAGAIKAVAVVHNETSTGVTSRVGDIRQAMNHAGHGALLLADTISSLGSMDFRHEEWGVDVTIGCSQKGLMLPPGLGFNAVSRKALDAAGSNRLPRSYWSWDEMLKANKDGLFPYTPATNLLFGLKKALGLLLEEGLDNVFARHGRHAEATRRAVLAWDLELQCQDKREYSASLTAVRMPEGHNADALRKIILERLNMSLGNGLGKVAGKVFRIGHLGDFNDLMLMGTLCGVEMGLKIASVPHKSGGVQAAMEYLSGC